MSLDELLVTGVTSTSPGCTSLVLCTSFGILLLMMATLSPYRDRQASGWLSVWSSGETWERGCNPSRLRCAPGTRCDVSHRVYRRAVLHLVLGAFVHNHAVQRRSDSSLFPECMTWWACMPCVPTSVKRSLLPEPVSFSVPMRFICIWILSHG